MRILGKKRRASKKRNRLEGNTEASFDWWIPSYLFCHPVTHILLKGRQREKERDKKELHPPSESLMSSYCYHRAVSTTEVLSLSSSVVVIIIIIIIVVLLSALPNIVVYVCVFQRSLFFSSSFVLILVLYVVCLLVFLIFLRFFVLFPFFHERASTL